MVRAVTEEQNAAVLSFFGYMVWLVCILVPLFFLTTLLFFVWWRGRAESNDVDNAVRDRRRLAANVGHSILM